MKKLVVFYSLEGNTKFIAQTIAETIEADLLELKPVREISKKTFLKYLVGGKQSLTKEQPPLHPLDKDPQTYDLIFLGTPVWAWTYAAPLHTFFSQVHFSKKKIALFCCHGGDKGKTLTNMENILKENEILGSCDFLNPLQKNTEQHRAKAITWAQSMLT